MDEKMDRKSNGLGRLRLLAWLTVGIFAVTLAVVIGNRLSNEALAVLAGAVCGVGAAIPTSLLIVAVSQRRREETRLQQPIAPPQGVYPPVIVVAPPGGRPQWPEAWDALPSLSEPRPRQFTIVGGDASHAEAKPYERYP